MGQRGDGPISVAAFVSSQKTEHGIDHITSCRALGVSQSWYYKWKNRISQDAPTARQRRRVDLDAQITHSFEASGGTYGSPRITRVLHEAGWRVSETRSRRGWPSSAWPVASIANRGHRPGRASGPPPRTWCGGSSPRSRRTCCGAAT
ncbi:IS3 family transposase [Nonomuraea sp. ZG12]|uniref:IS3 family transposase n=1 Tax=Nonomuraea sp. ZG12 TaxID=3452207 RepID=UPI003F895144